MDREWSCVGNVAEFRSLGSKALVHDQVIHATGNEDRMANQIGAPVTAPSDTVWIHPNGTLTVGSEATVNSGAWNTFTPGIKP
ncbi:hypothetical protein [Rhizobium leguminosarum]|uniref:hypothetical protein n=1 Tax=Rhizobium leguminosarum TaxID=384 RepID=UPI00131A2600|nr:hypothetical protein [Rhizobium leguminosarum]